MNTDIINKSYSTWIIIGLVLVIVGLIYFNRITTNKLATQSNALVSANDTLHKFKTIVGNQGAYISTIVADKDNLLSILSLKSQDSIRNKSLIDSLKKDKHFQSGSVVTTISKSSSTSDIKSGDLIIDTITRKITFSDSTQHKWYDIGTHIKDNKLTTNLTQRDQLNLTNNLKPNKGLFSGSTLTTYVTSANPDVNITGITSVSTVIDKRKIRLGTTIGPGVVINKTGAHIGGAIVFGVSF